MEKTVRKKIEEAFERCNEKNRVCDMYFDRGWHNGVKIRVIQAVDEKDDFDEIGYYILVNDYGVLNNEIAYDVWRGDAESSTRIGCQYVIHKEEKLREIEMNNAVTGICHTLSARRNAFEIGEQIEFMGFKFKITEIDGDKVVLMRGKRHYLTNVVFTYYDDESALMYAQNVDNALLICK